MSDIIVTIKPKSISWEDLARCQQRAHESNKASGVNMQCAEFSASDLKKEVEKGTTLVALDENGNLAGMLSIDFRSVNRWWHRGEAAYICYVAVPPEYKGKGIYRLLSQKASELIVDRNVNVEYLNTHIRNTVAQTVYEKDGYQKVRFSPGSGSDYYSVEMAKWLNGKGKNRFLCRLIYLASELLIPLLYKPGKIRRF